MIIETQCNPQPKWDLIHQGFSYTFVTPMIIDVSKIATAKPGNYVPDGGSIISVGGAEFGIAHPYELVVAAMRAVHDNQG